MDNRASRFYIPVHFFPLHKGKARNGVLEEVTLPGQFDTSAVRMFSRVLKNAGEPTLETTSGGVVFRLVVIRAFEGPLVVTMKHTWRRQIIKTKVLNVESRDQTKLIRDQRVKRVAPEQLGRFLTLLDSAAFCFNEYSRPVIPPEDGSEWLLERVDSEGYCAASMNSPNRSKLHIACLYLLTLAGFPVE